MATRVLLALGIGAAVATFEVARARADSIETTYHADVVETSHRVTVARDGERVSFTVRRDLLSRSDHPDEVSVDIQLPTAAVVDRLRYLVAGRWRTGTVMQRDAAERLYTDLTSSGRVAPRGPALLEWSDDGRVRLRLFPVPARGRVSVEYRLTAPLCYERGYAIADYPAAEADAHAVARLTGARLVARKQLLALLGRTDLDGLCAGLGFALDGDAGSYVVFDAPVAGPARVTLGHVDAGRSIGGAAHVVRLEVRVPNVIEPAPIAPRVVFVVDASHSVGQDGIDTQLALVRGYLAHTPDASVELVIYRRTAHRLFGRFVRPGALGAELAALAPHRLAPGNGSHLDAGLGLAARTAATRVVVFTDERLRRGFDVGRAVSTLGPLPKDAVLHVVAFGRGGGAFSWERDDDRALVPIARARGGVVAAMTGDAGGADDAMLGLVRPLSIDRVQAHLPGVSDDQLEFPEAFGGGEGYRNTFVSAVAPTGARVTGMVWGRVWEVPLVSSSAIDRVLPALVFGHPAQRELDDGAAAALALRASVVSPFTSLLARDPAAPPTSYEPDSLWGLSSSGCGCSGAHSIGVGHRGTLGHGVGEHVVPPDRVGLLRGVLRDEVQQCVGAGASVRGVSIDVETTIDEIVDVGVHGVGPTVTSCIAEAAWRLRLPSDVFGVPADVYRVSF
jgi:hypothetical protein